MSAARWMGRRGDQATTTAAPSPRGAMRPISWTVSPATSSSTARIAAAILGFVFGAFGVIATLGALFLGAVAGGIGDDAFGRIGGRGRADVGGKVDDRRVRLVPDGGDERGAHGGRGRRPAKNMLYSPSSLRSSTSNVDNAR